MLHDQGAVEPAILEQRLGLMVFGLAGEGEMHLILAGAIEQPFVLNGELLHEVEGVALIHYGLDQLCAAHLVVQPFLALRVNPPPEGAGGGEHARAK